MMILCILFIALTGIIFLVRNFHTTQSWEARYPSAAKVDDVSNWANDVEPDFVEADRSGSSQRANEGVDPTRIRPGLCEVKFATVVLAFPGYAHTAVFSEVCSPSQGEKSAVGMLIFRFMYADRWRCNSTMVCSS